MEEIDFKEYIQHWKIALNPSNQNFHNKMIRSLAINNKVDVISVRPFSRSLCDLKKLEKEDKLDGNITWHYIKVDRNPFGKIINGTSQVKKLVKTLATPDTIVICDTINPAVVHFAKNSVKHNPLIGVCTDSPSNISGTSRSYTNYLLKSASSYSGTISLTNELNDLFNPSGKPSLIIEGIVEDRPRLKTIHSKKPYFFFGGALMKRYGIYELIDAFNEINKIYPDKHLYIAGHHGNYDELKVRINSNEHIHLLGILPVEDVLAYEKDAIANINPRPFSEDLDRYSIPSKTLEYLVSKVPTISVKNTKLNKLFQEDIVWAKSGSKDDLKTAMLAVINQLPEEKTLFANRAYQKVMEYYSLESVNAKLNAFFDTISK